MRGGFAAGIIGHLYFISSAEIDTAVAVSRIAELDMQLKILKSLIGDDVRTRAWTLQYPVLNHPLIGLPGWVPSADVPAVEQLDRLSPNDRYGSFQ